MAPTCAIHFTPNVVALPDEMVGSALVPESPGFPWNWGHVYPEFDAPTGRDQLPPKTTAHTATTAHAMRTLDKFIFVIFDPFSHANEYGSATN